MVVLFPLGPCPADVPVFYELAPRDYDWVSSAASCDVTPICTGVAPNRDFAVDTCFGFFDALRDSGYCVCEYQARMYPVPRHA